MFYVEIINSASKHMSLSSSRIFLHFPTCTHAFIILNHSTWAFTSLYIATSAMAANQNNMWLLHVSNFFKNHTKHRADSFPSQHNVTQVLSNSYATFGSTFFRSNLHKCSIFFARLECCVQVQSDLTPLRADQLSFLSAQRSIFRSIVSYVCLIISVNMLAGAGVWQERTFESVSSYFHWHLHLFSRFEGNYRPQLCHQRVW